MLTHANVVGTGQTLIKAEDIRLEDNWLAYLPMAWVGDSLYTLVISLDGRASCVNCPESPETVQRDLRELGPTAVLAPPRIWENMLTSVQVRAADAAPPQALGVRDFRRRRRAGRDSPGGGQAGAAPACGCWSTLGEFFVYGPVRDQLGLRRARWALHGRGAAGPRHLPLLPRLRRQPQAGLRLDRDHRAGVAAARRRGQSRPPPAGRARVSTSRSATGARCWSRARGSSRATSRTTRPPARSSIAEGWFHTGDAGFIDPARPPGHHRPGQGRGRPARRHRLRAAVHREQAEVQPLHPGGGAPSATSARSSTAMIAIDLEHGGQLGRAARASPTPPTRT